MKFSWKLSVIVLLILMLVVVRAVEHKLFFDSFMYFFEGGKPSEYLSWSLHLKVALRFFVNSIISLAILYIAFQSHSVVKFSAILYVILFFVLFPLYVYLMGQVQHDDYLAAFYVRRFLIHPVILLLLLPAFYYQRLNGKIV